LVEKRELSDLSLALQKQKEAFETTTSDIEHQHAIQNAAMNSEFAERK